MKTKCNTNIYTTHCPSTKEVQYNLPTANDHDDTIPNAVGQRQKWKMFISVLLHYIYHTLNVDGNSPGTQRISNS